MPSHFEKYTTHHTSRRTDGWDYTQPAAYFITICTTERRCIFGRVERGRMILNELGHIVADEWEKSEAIRDRLHLDTFVVMPNHLHGIVVFADPEVEAPTCPRGYQAFGHSPTGAGGHDDSSAEDDETASADGMAEFDEASESTNASTDGSDDRSGGSNIKKASTGGSTLGGNAADRPTGPAPRSLGSFVAGFKSAATKRINNHRGTPGAEVWQRNYHDHVIRNDEEWRRIRRYIRTNPTRWH